MERPCKPYHYKKESDLVPDRDIYEVFERAAHLFELAGQGPSVSAQSSSSELTCDMVTLINDSNETWTVTDSIDILNPEVETLRITSVNDTGTESETVQMTNAGSNFWIPSGEFLYEMIDEKQLKSRYQPRRATFLMKTYLENLITYVQEIQEQQADLEYREHGEDEDTFF